MKFQPLTIDDIEKIKPYLYSLPSKTCDFTVGGMFMWRDFFHMEYFIKDGVFYSRLYDQTGECFYNLPIGPDMETTIISLISHVRTNNTGVKFCTIPEDYISVFKSQGFCISVTEERDYFDYLYSASDMAEMKGKKYSGQRNQINHFMRTAGSWDFVTITDENISQVIDFLSKTFPESALASSETEERAKVVEVLENYGKYNMVGSILYADSRVVGFSIGEVIRDTLYLHIEKADRNVPGAYQMLVQLFAEQYASGDIKYINREEDMGDLGLRTSKMSYHPLCLLKKYTVEVISNDC